jgi:uncharacterized membrane protein
MAVLLAGNLGWAQSTIKPQDRLREAVTDGNMITLEGNVHPALAHAASAEAVDASFPMEHLILLLKPDQAQQAALDELVAQQQNPKSAEFHKFLSPEGFAARFGASQNDIEKISAWLSGHGFKVEEVTANHLAIVFSGDAYAVENTFKTEIKQYSVNGELHHANASDPRIPAALAGIVRGVVKMHDFHAKSFARGLKQVDLASPQYTSGTAHYMGPADFAQIYDVHALYSNNLNGSGQSIALVGRSNVNLADVEGFRSQFGLPANNPAIIVAQGSNPGFKNDGDSMEATLDVEWAGAVAPQATVKLVIASSTAAADGVDLAAMYAVNHDVAQVLSVSFGSCEADMAASSSPTGGTEMAFYNTLWQQAAVQGMSVFVAAGDSGAAGCDSSSATRGTKRAINGMCSSPYATCVGGTEFSEGGNPGQYWLQGNNAVLGTAQGYIPEVVWNESGSDLAAGGGGVSIQWAKPSWQTGPGVPADGYRDVPDLSLSAAGHDGYLVFYNGSLNVVGGTSAAAPSLASLFTIVNQKYGDTQGNVNPTLYPLAVKQAQGGAVVFHDITSGNNTVPGVAGYSAGTGYDLASGLGSVDALQLVNHFHDVSLNGTFALTTAAAAASVQAGQNVTVNTTVSVSNGFNWPVTLTVSGLPAGVTASFNSATLAAPGAGTSALLLAAGANTASGAYTVTVTASGGSLTKTTTIALTVTAIPESCTLTASATALSMTVGNATNVKLTCTSPKGSLPASLALAVGTRPTGVTTSLSSATLTPGTGSSTLTITTATPASAGTFTLGITASGGTYSQTISLPITLVVSPSFSVTTSSTVSIMQNATATIPVVAVHAGSFNSALSLAVSSLPVGMTGTFAPGSFSAPGDGTSTLTLAPTITTPAGNYTIQVVASGGGLSKSVPLAVTVNATPNFTLAASQTAMTIQAGQTAGTMTATVKNLTNNFNSAVALSVSGLPTGVTGVFNSPTLAKPGTGTSTLTLTALGTAAAGQYKATISATGGSVTQTSSLLLTVVGGPGFTLKSSVSSIALTAGASFSTTLSYTAVNSFNSAVALTVGTLPAGFTATLSSPTISGTTGSALLTIQSAATAAAGSYSLTVAGTSALITTAQPSQTATIGLTLGSVTTTLSAATATVARSASTSITVTTAASGFAGSVVFTISGLPANVNYTFAPNALAGSGSTKLTISPNVSATPGTYTVTVKSSAGGTVGTNTFQLKIT